MSIETIEHIITPTPPITITYIVVVCACVHVVVRMHVCVRTYVPTYADRGLRAAWSRCMVLPMPQNSSSPRLPLLHTIAALLVGAALIIAALLTGGTAQAEAVCTTDLDCANWAVQHGIDPDADPHTKGKATLAAPVPPKGTGHSVGQEVPSCDHIDWSEVDPVDLNADGYIDCGSDLELGA